MGHKHTHTYEHTIEVRADSSENGGDLEIVVYDDVTQDAWAVSFSELINDITEDADCIYTHPDNMKAGFEFAATLEKLSGRLAAASVLIRQKAERSRIRLGGEAA
jgi:hypothetical protein